MEYPISIHQTVQTDVLIIGAGTAGVFAAVSAARTGASVLLAEKNAMPGGTLSVGGVDYPGIFHAWGKQIIDGPCYESIRRADELGGAVIPPVVYQPARHWMMQVRLNTFVYVHVLEEMLAECGAEVLYHVMPCAVHETENGVDAVLVGKGGNLLVRAHALIDASGDANAIRLAGYPLIKSDVLQPGTLINNLAGYTLSEVSEAEVNAAFDAAFASGELCARDLQGKRPMDLLRDGRIHSHIHTSSPETSKGKTQLETEARKTVFRVLTVFRRVKGLKKLYVSSFCTECGVRESVRIDAETNVTAADYIAGKRYDDAVCYAFYPIDLHTDHAIKQVFHAPGIVPTVPYTALLPKRSRYLLAAGRIVGSDTDANSALRVQAPCMAMGQAAGCAAALMAKHQITAGEVDYTELCGALCDIGAVVPCPTDRFPESAE